MNQTFDFGRWWMLVGGHWAENRKRYLLALLAMGGLLMAWYGFLLAIDKFGPLNLFLQYTAYHCGLYVVGCLYASTIFAELGSKARAIQYLSIPASHLEKLMCGILFGVVLFFLAYTLVFYLVDIPMVSMANDIIAREHQHWPGTMSPIGKVEVLNLWNNQWAPMPDKQYHLILLGYFVVQSAFLLGSVYFKRWGFIKTIVTILLCWLVFILFMGKGLQEFLPEGWHYDTPLQWINFSTPGPPQFVRLPPSLERILIFLIQYSIAPMLWFITYFRLKEKEV
ncbi:hypothetical protein Q4E93_32475 [Flavitalea sp. BT771]|uniref:hypothetical protein n=1 Tax=Flavitalea sp. BT771 TaxID=3063329 RepID=UPI0026E48BAE|nr:hypothetical protein [Flavitalea sp. BT771]MDO6435377.1 hypothetical protein [Flavitalea sp. BT771]MDV6224263.1 hypothetical protein [Flavitalea sp. BT771]